MDENDIAKIVFQIGMKIHKTLGPGLLENAYEECLFYELNKLGLFVQKQQPMPLIYEEIQLNVGYRVDLLIENKVVVEVKSVAEMHGIFFAQLLTYLKLSSCKLGLLINFNSELFKDGFRRVINGYI